MELYRKKQQELQDALDEKQSNQHRVAYLKHISDASNDITSDGAWTKRALNTHQGDMSFVSLFNSEFTISEEGEYTIEVIDSPHFQIANNADNNLVAVHRLYDITQDVEVAKSNRGKNRKTFGHQQLVDVSLNVFGYVNITTPRQFRVDVQTTRQNVTSAGLYDQNADLPGVTGVEGLIVKITKIK